MAEGFIQNEGCIDKLGSFFHLPWHHNGPWAFRPGVQPRECVEVCWSHLRPLGWEVQPSWATSSSGWVASEAFCWMCEVFLGKPIPKVIWIISIFFEGILASTQLMMWSTCSFSHRLGSHTKALTRSQAWDTNLILWQNIWRYERLLKNSIEWAIAWWNDSCKSISITCLLATSCLPFNWSPPLELWISSDRTRLKCISTPFEVHTRLSFGGSVVTRWNYRHHINII